MWLKLHHLCCTGRCSHACAPFMPSTPRTQQAEGEIGLMLPDVRAAEEHSRDCHGRPRQLDFCTPSLYVVSFP